MKDYFSYFHPDSIFITSGAQKKGIVQLIRTILNRTWILCFRWVWRAFFETVHSERCCCLYLKQLNETGIKTCHGAEDTSEDHWNEKTDKKNSISDKISTAREKPYFHRSLVDLVVQRAIRVYENWFRRLRIHDKATGYNDWMVLIQRIKVCSCDEPETISNIWKIRTF